MIKLIVNVKHFGLYAGWFSGEPFALFEIVLFEVNTELKMIDLVRIKFLKFSFDLNVDWQ